MSRKECQYARKLNQVEELNMTMEWLSKDRNWIPLCQLIKKGCSLYCVDHQQLWEYYPKVNMFRKWSLSMKYAYIPIEFLHKILGAGSWSWTHHSLNCKNEPCGILQPLEGLGD